MGLIELAPRAVEQDAIALLSAGLRQVGPEETHSVYKDIRDQINLSDEATSTLPSMSAVSTASMGCMKRHCKKLL